MGFNVDVRNSFNNVYLCARKSDNEMVNAYSEFLNISKQSPSVAQLIAKEEEQKLTAKYALEARQKALISGSLDSVKLNVSESMAATENIKKMKKAANPLLIDAHKKFDEAYKIMYARTGAVRKRIIEMSRVTVDSIQRNNKLPAWKRFLLFHIK